MFKRLSISQSERSFSLRHSLLSLWVNMLVDPQNDLLLKLLALRFLVRGNRSFIASILLVAVA